ncbi:hypothetical protein BDZ97DRAFT_1786531 [Flammula alnicola]|nr:hypothetical protein BDZ97DRAFT_1786531 [Flammula alnicola]
MASNMHVDQTSCQDRQLEEYEVLKAIYPDFISNSSAFSTDNIIRLKLGIELPSETGFQIFHSTPTYGLTLQATSITLLFLPPILIDVYLPKEYPSCQPPQILSISAEAQWFSKEDALRSTLLDSWQRGETILYSWIEFVRSGQFLRELDPSAGDGNVETIRLVHDVPEILIESLIQHDANARRMAFEKGSYTCAVCLEAHRGTKCVQLSCSHVFCKPCLEEFWTISVREGELTKVRCIDLGCMKSKKETSEEEIQEVLSSTAFSRWKWLKEKREFEKDSDHIYCLVCDGPVKAPDHGQEDGAWTRFRQCSSFHFTFCKVCKRAWYHLFLSVFQYPNPLVSLQAWPNVRVSCAVTGSHAIHRRHHR